jgi:hypothetical protein
MQLKMLWWIMAWAEGTYAELFTAAMESAAFLVKDIYGN